MKHITRHHSLAVGIGLIAAAVALTGCSNANGSPSAPAKDLTIAGVSIFAQDPYWLTVQCAAQAEAEKSGVDLHWYAGQGQDQAESQANWDSALLADPDAVLLAPPTVDGLTSQVEDAQADGIPVVMIVGDDRTYASAYNDGDASAFVDYVVKDIGTTGTVSVLGGVQGVPLLIERWSGIVTQLNSVAPDVTVLPTEYETFDRNTAAQIVAGQITANPDLTAVIAIGGSSALGAVAAIEEAGKTGEVRVYAYDSAPDEVAALKSGGIRALIAQPAVAIGTKAVQLAIHGAEANPDRKPVATSVGESTYPFAVLTKDNVDDPENAGYLYRTTCD